AGYQNTSIGVAGNEVARGSRRSTNCVAPRAVDFDARVAMIGQRAGAGQDGADEVPLHRIAGGARPGNEDAVAGVAGNEIAGAGSETHGGGAADDVVVRIIDEDARAVGQGGRAGSVGADEIPGDGVAVAVQLDAGAAEAADD